MQWLCAMVVILFSLSIFESKFNAAALLKYFFVFRIADIYETKLSGYRFCRCWKGNGQIKNMCVWFVVRFQITATTTATSIPIVIGFRWKIQSNSNENDTKSTPSTRNVTTTKYNLLHTHTNLCGCFRCFCA